MMSMINPRLTGFQCIRCGHRLPVADHPEGCPVCLAAGRPSSVAATYQDLPDLPPVGAGRGMSRFAARLAYPDFVTLGEGDTPLVALPRLAGALGLDTLRIKLESANPTGSHKDRMSAQFVTRARARGAPAVIAASSGNGGASVAAYAAAAGLACTIVTTVETSPVWRRAIVMTGAHLHVVETSMERWAVVRDKVRNEGYATATNYLDPPVGSDPFAVDAYKTVGYELAEAEDIATVDAILVPTARGDLLWGLHAGLAEAAAARRLARVPQLVAVEPFPRLAAVQAGADVTGHFPGKSALVSINGATATYQSLAALERSGGIAVAIDPAEAIADQRLLAANGLYLELSSVASLTALRELKRRGRTDIRSAILIGTSHGYKEFPSDIAEPSRPNAAA